MVDNVPYHAHSCVLGLLGLGWWPTVGPERCAQHVAATWAPCEVKPVSTLRCRRDKGGETALPHLDGGMYIGCLSLGSLTSLSICWFIAPAPCSA